MLPRSIVGSFTACAFTITALLGCTSAPTSTIPATAPTVAPSLASPMSPASPVPTLQPTPALPAPFVPGPNGTILFTRTDVTRDHDTWFEVFPDGSHERQLDADYPMGVWSPDGKTLAFPWGDFDQGKTRPALIHADGSGFRVLDPDPGMVLHLFPIAWSADGSRLFVDTGGSDITPDPGAVGLYSLRSSDGGDLRQVIATPIGYNEIFFVSPQGRILIFKGKQDDTDRILLIAEADGTDVRQVSPVDPDIQLDDHDWWDDASETWSANGQQAAFCAHHILGDEPFTLFVVGLSGNPRQIVGPDVGAATVRWSPDGQWLAFTSKLRAGAQVWKVRPDGTGLQQLTDGTDGSISLMPVWSPDSSHLLYQRQKDALVTLWTIGADGKGQRQISQTPLASDLVGGYAWWPPSP